MDHLWSPWRYNYVSSVPAEAPTGQRCLFCRTGAIIQTGGGGQQELADTENLVVRRDRLSFILLNRYPYSAGHVLIAPYAHVASLEEAETDALEEIMRSAKQIEGALRREYRPEGFNLGFNIGKCAGAGIAGHIHLHIIPRWTGDASFVTTVGETRVLPEELAVTYRRLREALG